MQNRYIQCSVKQTRDFTVYAAISTCPIIPLFKGRVKMKAKNFVNITKTSNRARYKENMG